MTDDTPSSAEPTPTKSPRRQLTIWTSFAAVLVVAVACAFYNMHDLKRRSQQITKGMPRVQVEELLGAPYLTLPRRPQGSGELLVWTDMFWQVDIMVDGDGQVLRLRCVPANSAYRRTQAKLSSLLQ